MSFNQKLYNNSPVLIQNLMCTIYGQKERNVRFGRTYKERFDFLVRNEYNSLDSIKEYQFRELKRIINHAYATVPYYRKLFNSHSLKPSDIKDFTDLNKIPILKKEDVRQNLTDMISTNYNKRRLIQAHTSGSTGKALDFYLTKDAIAFQWAVWQRFRNRFNINLGDTSLNFTGKLVVPINQKRPPYWRHNKAIDQYLINMQHIKPENAKSIASFINSKKFTFFSGYPSIIFSLAVLLEDIHFEPSYPPRIIMTGAEQLYDNQKEQIERVFRARVVDHYGFSEGAGNASKCEMEVFHEDFEFGYIEIDSDNSDNTKPMQGNLICTGFANYAMPFLRYHVGDVATINEKQCNCGLHSKSFSRIEGRSEDFIITPEGVKILRFDYLFKDTNSIKECQVVQRKLGQIIFRIVKRDNYSTDVEKILEKRVREWISRSIDVTFEYEKSIERTSHGKFKAVKSYITH